ncbi:hypothetical protein shn_20955 [Shinella sp. HZN7]|nr:hypothetical protein shn_20955 [Shinella sp. HZN7]
MNSETSVVQTQRDLLRRIHTEGVMIAYDACIDVCRDPKAPANARQAAAATLFRAAGYFGQQEKQQTKEPHEMTAEEIQRAIADLSERIAGKAVRSDDDDGGMFD